MANSLTAKDVKWALAHLEAESDTDLFPRAFELTILGMHRDALIQAITKLDLVQHAWDQPRRYLVPKDDFAFRSACQLSPFDALLFAALVKRIVRRIEARRGDRERSRIFSYRTRPLANGALYGIDRYQAFWKASKNASKSCAFVLVTDITDFYNQIYHHTIEQELGAAGAPVDIASALRNLLTTCSATTSRGVPVGPHVSHLLAELALRPIDAVLVERSIRYHRYVDDFHMFFDTESAARGAYYAFTQALDLTKNIPNPSKTKILTAPEFRTLARKALRGGAVGAEAALVKGIRSVTKGSYRRAKRVTLTPELERRLTQEHVGPILQRYLRRSATDYAQLRWLFRRLAQTGSAAAVPFALTNFLKLLPAAGDVCRYFDAVTLNAAKADAVDMGAKILDLLADPNVAGNQYFLVTLIHLFAKSDKLNHLPRLIAMYDRMPPAAQREIVLAAWRGGSSGWLRTLKSRTDVDGWTRRAIVLGSAEWTDDEREHWTKHMKRGSEAVEKLVLETVRNQKDYDAFVAAFDAFHARHI